MKIKAHERFRRDLSAVSSKTVKRQALDFIDDAGALTFEKLGNAYDLKRLEYYGEYYRLRIEDYRLGCADTILRPIR